MTEAELQAIKSRAKAATSGPWETSGIQEGPDRRIVVWAGNGDIPVCDCFPHVLRSGDQQVADAVFLSSARQDVEALVAYVGKIEGLLRDLSVVDQRGVYQKGCQDGRRSVAELLEKIQWSGSSGLWQGPDGGTYLTERLCPACHEQEPGPHKEGCRLWELIR
jgi:hypothetical protein